MKRDPISLDLHCGEVIHIPKNSVGTETIRTREGPDEIGTDLPPENEATPGLFVFSR